MQASGWGLEWEVRGMDELIMRKGGVAEAEDEVVV